MRSGALFRYGPGYLLGRDRRLPRRTARCDATGLRVLRRLQPGARRRWPPLKAAGVQPGDHVLANAFLHRGAVGDPPRRRDAGVRRVDRRVRDGRRRPAREDRAGRDEAPDADAHAREGRRHAGRLRTRRRVWPHRCRAAGRRSPSPPPGCAHPRASGCAHALGTLGRSSSARAGNARAWLDAVGESGQQRRGRFLCTDDADARRRRPRATPAATSSSTSSTSSRRPPGLRRREVRHAELLAADVRPGGGVRQTADKTGRSRSATGVRTTDASRPQTHTHAARGVRRDLSPRSTSTGSSPSRQIDVPPISRACARCATRCSSTCAGWAPCRSPPSSPRASDGDARRPLRREGERAQLRNLAGTPPDTQPRVSRAAVSCRAVQICAEVAPRTRALIAAAVDVRLPLHRDDADFDTMAARCSSPPSTTRWATRSRRERSDRRA